MVDLSVDLDLAELLSPITPEQPAGVDLRKSSEYEAVFSALKDAFDSAVHWEDEGEKAKDPYLETHERELLMKNLRIPDWDAVSEQAVEILSRRSKDLRVTAWLIEALVRTRGVAGLHFGLQLLRELCQTYWDQIYERPDASGVTMTVAPIAKLGRRMCLQAIRSMPILASSSYGKLSARDYRASQGLERLTDGDERQRQIDDGVLPLAEFDAAAAAVAAEEWDSVRAMFEATSNEVDQLNRWLNDRCGSEAPSLGGVASAVQECLEVVDQLAPVPTAAASGSAVGDKPVEGTVPSVSGAITTRREAFETLRRVAQFFRDTEPQSPLCWQLERVVRLGQLAFPDLLVEIVRDGEARAALAREIGTDLPASPE